MLGSPFLDVRARLFGIVCPCTCAHPPAPDDLCAASRCYPECHPDGGSICYPRADRMHVAPALTRVTKPTNLTDTPVAPVWVTSGGCSICRKAAFTRQKAIGSFPGAS